MTTMGQRVTMHLFAASALAPVFAPPKTLCGQPVKEGDVSVSEYGKMCRSASEERGSQVCPDCERALSGY